MFTLSHSLNFLLVLYLFLQENDMTPTHLVKGVFVVQHILVSENDTTPTHLVKIFNRLHFLKLLTMTTC